MGQLRTSPVATACRPDRRGSRRIGRRRSSFRGSRLLLRGTLDLGIAPQTIAGGDVRDHEREERQGSEDVDEVDHEARLRAATPDECTGRHPDNGRYADVDKSRIKNGAAGIKKVLNRE